MKKLSDKEKKATLASLALHMKQVENSIYGMIKELRTEGYPASDRARRVLRLKQILLSLKVEYNNIKLRCGENDTQN